MAIDGETESTGRYGDGKGDMQAPEDMAIERETYAHCCN